MKILSIHPGHNATAGLFIDGKCAEYHHEERFTDIKNYSAFPYLAVAHILSKYDPKTIEQVVVPHEGVWDYHLEKFTQENRAEGVPTEHRQMQIRAALNLLAKPIPALFKIKLSNLARAILYAGPKKRFSKMLADKFGISAPVKFLDHHTCHAVTPLYFYNIKNCGDKILLITADAGGGDSCSKIFIYDTGKNEINKIAHSYYSASLGYLYALTTKYLGMKPGEHEYKVMGLAAYSTDSKYWSQISDKLKRLIYIDSKTLTLQSTIDMTEAMPKLKKIFDEQRFDNISAAVQDAIECKIIELTRAAIAKTGIRNVAFSGGVFMNVKMNQKIAMLPEVERCFFQPSSGDESLGIGAAALVSMSENENIKPIETMYTGINYSSEQIKNILEQSPHRKNLKIKPCADIEEEISTLLANHEIVARFSGAGEWGARSLCNRGILANASDMKSFYMVNDMVKMRDFWMPFAPTILADWAPKYISDWEILRKKSHESMKYMIVTVDSTPLARDHLRAAIHQKDKTLRPQILEEKDNPSMYKILRLFEKKTKMGGVMNTSFNLHGSPLVGSPEIAIETFVNSGLKYMALENYLICKE